MTTTVTELIVTGNDDGYMDEEYYYGMYDSSASALNRTHARVRFGQSSTMGDINMHHKILTGYFRFQTVNVPQGASIVTAKLQLAFHSTGTGAGNTLDIYANDVDDASAPSTLSDFQSKVKTTEKVTWTLPSGSAGTYYDTPDISDVVQEIVDRSGWAANNDMMFILPSTSWNSSTNWLYQFRSYNYGGSFKPKLVIEYSTATASAVPMALNTYQQMRNN
tara:strand:- start:2044 stop:2703 length:660 start_codon:yes stop_codon:yes gene_type:complete